jgi:hypothetical protein
MDRKEFRVGNYVMHPLFQQPTTISAIAFNGLYIGSEGGVPLPMKDFKPVEITSEILLKAGFTKLEKPVSKSSPIAEYKYKGVRIAHDISGLFYYRSKGLRYVHTLQNLFFALKGYELNLEL